MRLTPIRCDVCGKLCYLEEETMFRLVIEGQSEWVKNEETILDVCSKCKDEILGFISELQEGGLLEEASEE